MIRTIFRAFRTIRPYQIAISGSFLGPHFTSEFRTHDLRNWRPRPSHFHHLARFHYPKMGF